MAVRILSLFAAVVAIAQGGITASVDQTSLGGNLYLVNQTFQLSRDYVPPDLMKPAVRAQGSITLRREAADALEALFTAARESGYTLVAVSGYRSYASQRAIYNRKVSSTGSDEKAGLLVALPGSSEHQLGLAVDLGRVSSTQLNSSFGRSKEGQWLSENAHRFGFIVRYRAQWTDITGIAEEPWHIRFVGVPHAMALKNLDMPLELYVYELSKASFGAYFTEGFGR